MRISLVTSAGTFGTPVGSRAAWTLECPGISRKMDVAFAPSRSIFFSHNRLVRGAPWEVRFSAPFRRSGFRTGVFSRRILLGAVPAWFQLLCVFPFFQGLGATGLAPGKQPPCSYFFLHGGLGFFYRILALCDKGRLLKSGSPCFVVS